MKRVFVQSFGCRASQGEGDDIARSFAERGLEIVAEAGQADLIVLNTCTVTAAADSEARHTIRRYHRAHPDARILVTGCYAQRDPGGLASIAGVDWVAGNSHKHQIADLVTLRSGDAAGPEYHGRVFVGEIGGPFTANEITDIREDRTRPNLKVQDGCSNRCSFCVIPSVRGRSRSAPLENVIGEMRRLAPRYSEIVLTGINLGRWGRDLSGTGLRFIDLVRALLAETEVRRLRLSSVEPMDWSDELLELMAAEPRIAQHVHAPLQSGSDRVLKRMFRKYRVRHYESRISLARRLMPLAAIGADVLVGFPGETEQDFAETVAFIRAQPFTYLHVFTYSERPGTAAASYGDVVPVEVRRERNRVLRELSEEKNRTFREQMRGRTLSAVTLEQRGLALTTNFLRVQLAQDRAPNQLIDVRIGDVNGVCLAEELAMDFETVC